MQNYILDYSKSGKQPNIRELTLLNGISYPDDEELIMLILGKGSSYPVTDRSIDVQILGIRKKIGDSPESSNPFIETLRGVGYRICEE